VTADPVPSGKLGRAFGLLWAGQTASLLGDQVTLIALPLIAVAYTAASTFDVGLLATCLRAPFLLIGLPAGVWVSRLGLRRSMIAADALRLSVIAMLPVAIWSGVRSVALLLVAALLLGFGTVFFQVAYQSLVPELLPDRRHWHRANTRLSLSESSSQLVGPAGGGLLVGLLTSPGALVMDAVTYAVSVATLTATGRGNAGTVAPSASTKTEVLAGLRYVRSTPVLNSIMWTGAAYNLGAAMYESLLVVFAVRHLGLSPAGLGVALGAGGVGFPIGGALVGRLTRRLGLGQTLIWAAVPSVGGMLVSALATNGQPALWLAAGTLLIGVGQGIFAVNAITIRQLAAEPSMQARATSVHRFVSWGALSVGSLLAGLIGRGFGVRPTMLMTGAVSSACFWPLLASPLRTIRTADDIRGDGTSVT
jgi:MFS family permease